MLDFIERYCWCSRLCSPTGAALMRYFVNDFRDIQDMAVIKSGCGIGGKDFGIPGGLRAYYGEYPVVNQN